MRSHRTPAKCDGQVLGCLLDHPAGLTDEELEHALHVRPGSGRARRCELTNEGQVHDSGKTRIGECGRPMTIWVARSAAVNPSPATRHPSPLQDSGGNVGARLQGPGTIVPVGAHVGHGERSSTAESAEGRGETISVHPAPSASSAVQSPDPCPKCKATEFIDVPIHGGRSTRRDCKICHRFIKFVLWHGKAE